jgi:hypothetical protein
MFHISGRNQDPLLAGQPLSLTNIKKSFNLLRRPANWLDVAPLVNLTSHGNTLFNRNAAQTREQGVQLRR